MLVQDGAGTATTVCCSHPLAGLTHPAPEAVLHLPSLLCDLQHCPCKYSKTTEASPAPERQVHSAWVLSQLASSTLHTCGGLEFTRYACQHPPTTTRGPVAREPFGDP